MPRPTLIRLVAVGLSAGGIFAALGFWAAGRSDLGLRVLAGDVLVLAMILVLA